MEPYHIGKKSPMLGERKILTCPGSHDIYYELLITSIYSLRTLWTSHQELLVRHSNLHMQWSWVMHYAFSMRSHKFNYKNPYTTAMERWAGYAAIWIHNLQEGNKVVMLYELLCRLTFVNLFYAICTIFPCI